MKPILFNTEMVKAILDGRKTTTRRPIKPMPKVSIEDWSMVGRNPHQILTDGCGNSLKPAYQVGDVLYVRETFGTYHTCCGMSYVYKAEYIDSENLAKALVKRWRPSIFMPKEAARIFLRVTDVKAERLQDITEDGAIAEGIRSFTKDGQLNKFAVSTDSWADYHNKHKKDFHGNWWQDMPKNPTTAFSYLWNTTVNKADLDKYSWNVDPWVWVISFERTARPDEK